MQFKIKIYDYMQMQIKFDKIGEYKTLYKE